MIKINVAVFFGGRSPEHEISIITGIQVLNSLDVDKYNVLPIYVSKNGDWILGDKSFYKIDTFKKLDEIVRKYKSVYIAPIPKLGYLSSTNKGNFLANAPEKIIIDVAFPVFHGKYGEDGAFQGLFEILDIPYVGSDVVASSVGMDKIVTKNIASGLGIPTPKGNWCNKTSWLKNPKLVLSQLLKGVKFPVYVKPARLGSSIGITRVNNTKQLIEAVDVAFFYDSRVVVEEAIENAKEINISLLGRNPYKFSVCEQPMSSGVTLSFSDKYLSSGGTSMGMASLKRIVPAKIRKETEDKIRRYAEQFFAAIGGEGVVRIDFLVTKDEKQIYFGEANTIPGSLAFYLWKEKNLDFNKLADELITQALERQKEKDSLTTTFEGNVLEGFSGTKASKLQ